MQPGKATYHVHAGADSEQKKMAEALVVNEFMLSKFLSSDSSELCVQDLPHLREYLQAELARQQTLWTNAAMESRIIDVKLAERGEADGIREALGKTGDEMLVAGEKREQIKSMLRTIEKLQRESRHSENQEQTEGLKKLMNEKLTDGMWMLSRQFRELFLGENARKARTSSVPEAASLEERIGKAIADLKDAAMDAARTMR